MWGGQISPWPARKVTAGGRRCLGEERLGVSGQVWEFRFLPRDRKGTPKNFCDKDFAELSGELSGVICLKTLALMGHDQKPPRIVQKILWRFVRFFGFGVLFWLLILAAFSFIS